MGGCTKGGIGGYSQAVGASIMVSFIDFFCTTEIEALAELSGTYKGEGCDAKARQIGAMAIGMIAMQAIPGGGKAGGKIALKGVEKELLAKGIGAEVSLVRRGGGRLGGPLHRATVTERANTLADKGYTITGGGGRRPERSVITPDGKRRFPDISAIDPSGRPYYENVGRSTSTGNPIAREQRALDDIRRATGRDAGYIPYDR